MNQKSKKYVSEKKWKYVSENSGNMFQKIVGKFSGNMYDGSEKSGSPAIACCRVALAGYIVHVPPLEV